MRTLAMVGFWAMTLWVVLLGGLRGPFGVGVHVALAASPAGASSPPAPRVALRPRPAWVVPVDAPLAGAAPDGGAGSNQGLEELLLDQQVDLTHGVERYVRRVRRIVTRGGAEVAGQVHVDFEPSFQSAAVHGVWIVRDGQRIDALKAPSGAPAPMRLVNKQRELDEQIYDGTVTALWVVSDLRVGDVLDVDYTVSGHNPVFGGKFSSVFTLGTGRGALRAHLRARVPEGRSIQVRPLGPGAGPPAIRVDASAREYEWTLLDVRAPEDESGTPPWFRELPEVSVSEFASWQDVAAWARALFEVPSPKDGPLAQRVAQLAAENPTPAGRALAAVRFVQHEVRYMGIEMGESSHRPHPPDQVYAQRFGDCKDKTLLLLTMLRALGISGSAALVNTSMKAHLSEELPAPTVFDHVVVRMVLDGRDLWVDPTRSEEFGPLGETPLPFGRALVVGEGEDARDRGPAGGDLSRIEAKAPSEPLTRTVDTLRVDGTSATLDTETTYRGADATQMRDDLANELRAKLETHRLSLVAMVYPKAERAAPLTVTDDVAKNVVTLQEHYRIPDVIDAGAVDVRAQRIRALLARAPRRGGTRRTPVAVEYPAFVQQEIRIYGPRFELPEPVSVESRAFAFQYTGEVLPDHVVLFFDYRAREDSVDAVDAELHAARLSAALDATSLSLELPVPKKAKPQAKVAAPPKWMFIPIGFVIAVVIAAVVTPPVRRALRRRDARLYGGETAAQATVAKDRDDATARVAARKCACGARVDRASVTWSEVRLGDTSVDAGRAKCGTCGTVHVRYFVPPS